MKKTILLMMLKIVIFYRQATMFDHYDGKGKLEL